MGGSTKKRGSSKSSMWSSSKAKKKKSLSGINETSAAKLFDVIADPDDPSTVNMEGIFSLGEKLDMDATEDIRILVLLWKMGCAASKPGEISKDEWMQGCATLSVDSWDKINNLKPQLDTGFLEQSEFKDFYKFCFQFNRQGTHRTLDKELVIQLLQLVLKDTNRVSTERLDTFCEFLSKNLITRITADQWVSFLDFCQEVPDLNTYDESTSAWPVLIDEYVEFMEEIQKKKSK